MNFDLRSFLCLGYLPPPTLPRDHSSSQEGSLFWNDTQSIKPLGRSKDLIIIGVLCVGRDFGRPVDERIGAGLTFKSNKYLT